MAAWRTTSVTVEFCFYYLLVMTDCCYLLERRHDTRRGRAPYKRNVCEKKRKKKNFTHTQKISKTSLIDKKSQKLYSLEHFSSDCLMLSTHVRLNRVGTTNGTFTERFGDRRRFARTFVRRQKTYVDAIVESLQQLSTRLFNRSETF